MTEADLIELFSKHFYVKNPRTERAIKVKIYSCYMSGGRVAYKVIWRGVVQSMFVRLEDLTEA